MDTPQEMDSYHFCIRGMKVLPREGLAHPQSPGSSALTWPSSTSDQNVSRRFWQAFEWRSRLTVPRCSWGHLARDRSRGGWTRQS